MPKPFDMIENIKPSYQALLGTLFTWGLTALGSGVVFLIPGAHRSVLDRSLGFAGGVMTAASFWSLLDPAIELASESGSYGVKGQYAFIPIAIGFLFGAAFVYAADTLMTQFGVHSIKDILEPVAKSPNKKEDYDASNYRGNILLDNFYDGQHNHSTKTTVTLDMNELKRRKAVEKPPHAIENFQEEFSSSGLEVSDKQWKRILLLIVAITVHNIPEGLAVGVGFGAIGRASSATFSKAKNLAIGIGIQNFPEGMAVSLPLRGAGYSLFSAFWWGQLSGMVEPIAGVLGAIAVGFCEPILPYALSFAAGAMIFVVVDDIIPEAQTHGNGRLSSFWFVGGFVTMMILDVSLG